jgi:hypothetical protein
MSSADAARYERAIVVAAAFVPLEHESPAAVWSDMERRAIALLLSCAWHYAGKECNSPSDNAALVLYVLQDLQHRNESALRWLEQHRALLTPMGQMALDTLCDRMPNEEAGILAGIHRHVRPMAPNALATVEQLFTALDIHKNAVTNIMQPNM